MQVQQTPPEFTDATVSFQVLLCEFCRLLLQSLAQASRIRSNNEHTNEK